MTQSYGATHSRRQRHAPSTREPDAWGSVEGMPLHLARCAAVTAAQHTRLPVLQVAALQEVRDRDRRQLLDRQVRRYLAMAVNHGVPFGALAT